MLINSFQTAAASMKVRNTTKMYDTNMQPLWWDDECDDLKQVKYTANRKFRLPNDREDLQFYIFSKKDFKKRCKMKKKKKKTNNIYLSNVKSCLKADPIRIVSGNY